MRPEAALQRQIRQFITDCGLYSVHVPNGAVLSGDKAQRARQMNALKRDGLVVGFPDLLVYGKGQRIGHIEVKTPKGAIGDNQNRVREWLEAMGHHYAVCRSVDDTAAAFRSWGWMVEFSPSPPVDKYGAGQPLAAGFEGLEQNEAEECSSTPRPTPETLNRSATDAA